MKNKILSLVILGFQSTVILQAETLEDIEIVGSQDSYYEDSSQTALKGNFLDTEVPFTTNVTKGTLINDLHALRLDDTYEYTTGLSRSGTSADS